jgi:tRNA pseudouridine13 synthase
MLPALAFYHGKPESSGDLRTHMSDFKVFEQLPFQPCGEGEHLLIHIRKAGVNTIMVARLLAKYFSVKEHLVSYAGLKDRFAVTEQWFGVHVPGKTIYDLSDLAIDGVEVLFYARHNKKLRTGALTGNRFELTLRNVTAIEALKARWQQIIDKGVPNYFGEQRFGIDAGNLDKAKRMFGNGKQGTEEVVGKKVRDKKKRGLYLSAARSFIFNQVVSERIEQQRFSRIEKGDVCMLAGTQSVFLVSEVDQTLTARLIEKDIDITAPMWGAGELMTTGEPLILEQKVAEQQPEFSIGLPRFGLKQERRRSRLSIANATLVVEEQDADNATVLLTFSLPAGCYATTILRELIDYQDLTQRAGTSA